MEPVHVYLNTGFVQHGLGVLGAEAVRVEQAESFAAFQCVASGFAELADQLIEDGSAALERGVEPFLFKADDVADVLAAVPHLGVGGHHFRYHGRQAVEHGLFAAKRDGVPDRAPDHLAQHVPAAGAAGQDGVADAERGCAHVVGYAAETRARGLVANRGVR